MQALEILQQHQLKKTSPRLAIIEVLQSAITHLAEAEISEQMGSHYDRTTFYRSMQTLSDAGVIHRIVIDRFTVKYALRQLPDHAHFYCNNCRKLICLEDVQPGPYNLPVGFQTSEAEVIIKGLCNKCSK